MKISPLDFVILRIANVLGILVKVNKLFQVGKPHDYLESNEVLGYPHIFS